MELGVLIPIFALAIPIIAIWTSHQRKMAELDLARRPADDAATGQLQGRVKELEERVRVLERIVTDGSHGLAASIDALRDLPPTKPDAGVAIGLDKERV